MPLILSVRGACKENIIQLPPSYKLMGLGLGLGGYGVRVRVRVGVGVRGVGVRGRVRVRVRDSSQRRSARCVQGRW